MNHFRRIALSVTAILLCALHPTQLHAATAQSSTTSAGDMTQEWLEQHANAPFVFRQNMGQWDSEILYQGTHQGATIRLLRDGLSFVLRRPQAAPDEAQRQRPGRLQRVSCSSGTAPFTRQRTRSCALSRAQPAPAQHII